MAAWAHTPDHDTTRLSRHWVGERRRPKSVGEGFSYRSWSVANLVLTNSIRTTEQVHEAFADTPIGTV